MIYTLDHNNETNDFVRYTLIEKGYDIKTFGNISDFWDAIFKELPQLVLLNIDSNQKEELNTLKELRIGFKTNMIPIIVISEQGTEKDKAEAFNNGADDYIASPFSSMELMVRIQSLFRGQEEYDGQIEYF